MYNTCLGTTELTQVLEILHLHSQVLISRLLQNKFLIHRKKHKFSLIKNKQDDTFNHMHPHEFQVSILFTQIQ